MRHFPDISSFNEIAYDTETTGLNPKAGARVFGFSVSLPDGRDFYWDVRETPESVVWFNDSMQKFSGTIICHNLSFDYRVSKASGIFFPLDQSIDTCILACLINEHEKSYSLDNLSRKYTSFYKKGDALYEQLALIFGGKATRNVQMKNIHKAPSDIVAPYAIGDTRATFALYQYQKAEIKRQKLERIVEFERQVTPVLIGAEEHGVRVDTAKAEKSVGLMSQEIIKAQERLDSLVGFHCNPHPGKSMDKVFSPKWKDGRWIAIDGTPLNETSTGKASLDSDALRRMCHPAAKEISELRSLIKTRDTFLVGHVLESSYGGRVYPSINQTKGDKGGAISGRLSYAGPALQQIPDRNKAVAKILKSVFLPDEGHVWVDSDMASFEVRIFAHLVGTKDIIKSYEDDPETDFHQFVADMTGMVRNATYNGQPNAKQLNLSMIFNQGNGTTAEKMAMPWDWDSFVNNKGEEIIYKKAGAEAMEVINRYHARLPGVKSLADGCRATAENRGWIFTKRGRHLRFPDKRKSYKASGLLIQATSADENKENWLRISSVLEDTGGRLLLNTHDSYGMSLPEGESLEIAKKVKKCVEENRALRVPLILEVQMPGKTWWESKSSKRWM